MGPDPFGTGTKLVRMSLVFTRDLVDPDRICYLVPNGSTSEGDYGTPNTSEVTSIFVDNQKFVLTIRNLC